MLISTIRGDIDHTQLKEQSGVIDNENERTRWTEYWHGGDPACEHTFDMHAPRLADGAHVCLKCDAHQVRRDVAMTLKKMPAMAGAVSSFR